MAKRFTDTEKWKKPFIKKLEAPYKLLWFYILDDCDISGLWQVDLEIAEIRIGHNINHEEALKVFENKIIVLDGGERWFIPDFLEFQYGGQLSKNNNIFKSIEKILSKYDLYQYLSIDIVEQGSTISSFRNRISRKTKDRIILDANLTCEYCQEQKNKTELVVDHFIPLKNGGDNSDSNLICCCIRCNSHKTDIMPDVFLEKPHNFLNPSEKIKSLIGAFKDLKAYNNPLLGAKDKDKDTVIDKDKEKDIVVFSPAFLKFQEWLKINCLNVTKLKEPFTEQQYLKLTATYDRKIVQEVLESMHNSKDLLKKYNSAYLTCLNWIKIRNTKANDTKKSTIEQNNAVANDLINEIKGH